MRVLGARGSKLKFSSTRPTKYKILKIEPNTAASFRVLIGPFTLPGTTSLAPKGLRVPFLVFPGEIVSGTAPLNFIALNSLVPMGGFADFVKLFFLASEGRYIRRLNYFELDPWFALVLILIATQSYAQVTISLIILHASPKVIHSKFISYFVEKVLGSPILQVACRGGKGGDCLFFNSGCQKSPKGLLLV